MLMTQSSLTTKLHKDTLGQRGALDVTALQGQSFVVAH